MARPNKDTLRPDIALTEFIKDIVVQLVNNYFYAKYSGLVARSPEFTLSKAEQEKIVQFAVDLAFGTAEMIKSGYKANLPEIEKNFNSWVDDNSLNDISAELPHYQDYPAETRELILLTVIKAAQVVVHASNKPANSNR